MVGEQTKDWTEMVSRQLLEEHNLKKVHVQQQSEALVALMNDAQCSQLKELELKHERCGWWRGVDGGVVWMVAWCGW